MEDQQATRIMPALGSSGEQTSAPVRHRRAARYAAPAEETPVEEQPVAQPMAANVRRVAPAAPTAEEQQPRVRMNQREQLAQQPSQGVPRPAALMRSPAQGQSVQTAGPVTRPQQGNRKAVNAPGYTQQQPVQPSPYARPQDDRLRARRLQQPIYDAAQDEWEPLEDTGEVEAVPRKRRGGLIAVVTIIVMIGVLVLGFLLIPNDDSTLGRVKGQVQSSLNGLVSSVTGLLHQDASAPAEVQEFSAAPIQGTAPMDVVFTLTTNKTATGVRVVNEDGEPLTATAAPYSDNAESRIWMLTLTMDGAWSGTVEAQVQGADGNWIASGRTQTLEVLEPVMTTIAADVFNETTTEAPTAVPTEIPTEIPTEAPTQMPVQALSATDEPTAPEDGTNPDENGDGLGLDDDFYDEPGMDDGLDDLADEPDAQSTDGQGAAVVNLPEKTAEPTAEPTEAPTPTLEPTAEPTAVPTPTPTEVPTPTPLPDLTAEAADSADPSKLGLTETAYENSKKLKDYTRDEKSVFDMGDQNSYLPLDFGVATFRGSNFRQNAASGNVSELPNSMSLAWTAEAGSVAGASRNYYGIGWTGQPAIIKWSKEVRAATNIVDSKRDTPALKEVIVAGLDGKIYFLDLADGQPTRDAIDVGYPMKGSVSLNAYGMPVMAVGQYARKMKSGTGDIGVRFYNLLNQKQLYLLDGLDGKLKRPISEDGAFDTSVLFDRTNDGVVAAGSNGLLYTLDMGTEFDANQGSISISPKARVLAAKVSGQKSKGVKVLSSMAMYESYAYYADMTGVLHCVDTTTMKTMWAVATGDEVNAAISLDFDDNGTLWLYTANTLTNRNKGNCQIRRYNAMTGALDWTQEIGVRKQNKSKVVPGAMASAVIGTDDIDGLVIYTISSLMTDPGVTINGADGAVSGAVIALNKKDGSVAWTRALDDYSYSSPVAVYSKDGESWIVQASASGTLYLLKGLTGEVVSTLKVDGTIEGSPAVYGSTLVIGTTGKDTAHIYGISLD
mgnify:CR=1 FL=1